MLNFMVYDPAEAVAGFPPESALTIRQFLAHPPGWRPDPGDTLLMFDALSDLRNEDFNKFGYLDHIVPQLIEAAERLRRGRFALLRTAGDHEACWLIFEPAADVVHLSFLGVLGDPFGCYFPLERSPFHSEGVTQQHLKLYDHVERNRGVLGEQPLLAGSWRAINGVALPTAALLPALLEQADLGAQLSALLKSQ